MNLKLAFDRYIQAHPWMLERPPTITNDESRAIMRARLEHAFTQGAHEGQAQERERVRESMRETVERFLDGM